MSPLGIPVIANVTAEPYQDSARVRTLLTEQVTGSVRWEESMRALLPLGVAEAFEVGPGAVLAGLAKRIVPTLPLRKFEEVSHADARL